MKILVTGRSGTGKTTLYHEFVKAGVRAFDSDRLDNFVEWRDLRTGQLATPDYTKPIDKTKIGWLWHQTAVKQLVAKYDDFILCGSADNQLDFYSYFNKVFVLDLPPRLQKQRILERTEHDYGKQPEMLDRIIAEQAKLVKDSRDTGAKIVPANVTPRQIARYILEAAHDN